MKKDKRINFLIEKDLYKKMFDLKSSKDKFIKMKVSSYYSEIFKKGLKVIEND